MASEKQAEPGYTFRDSEEFSEGQASDLLLLNGQPERAERPLWKRTGFLVSVLLNFVLGIILSVIGIQWIRHKMTLNTSLRKVSSYSPIHDLLELEPSIKLTNGTLFPNNHPSVARRQPNPETDEIWDEWELTRVFPLRRRDIEKMGKDWTTVAKLEDKYWSLGDDAYVGVFDVYHQLHCLNSLRKIAYGGYYNMSQLEANPKALTIQHYHLNHCVDMLMQAIQCSGNVNIITQDWVETQSYPFPDMSINRQCINFEKLTAWRKEHTIDMEKYVDVMEKPEGVKQRPQADAYYDYYGITNPNHINGANPGEDFNI